MPDRGQFPDEITPHFFAEGDYVAVTGWPDMVQTVTGSGWVLFQMEKKYLFVL